MRTGFLATFAVLCWVAVAVAQVTPDKSVGTLKTPADLQVQLWASEPLFVNPTTMDIDHLGRVWVCEAVNYRRKLRNQPPIRSEGDRIVILTDTDSDGMADKATTFYQSPEIMAPLGISVLKDATGPGYHVMVCQSPNILLFIDKDGDGKADGPPTKWLTGFGGLDHDHGVHGVSMGPDGKMYFSVGDTGVENLQGADKQGRKWTRNSTDVRAGTVWRCEPDGGKLELIAHNFRNNYMPTVDSFGTVFISDNDDDGNQQTRICYVMPGGNYGYHPRGPGQTHWHEEQPGIVHKILRTYFGSPTGMCMYEGTLLPPRFFGMPLHTDAGPRHLRCYHLKPQGAGYSAEAENMLESTDTWFRPSDVKVAPDGSVLVADWYDPGVGGHGMGDIKQGRIFRLTPKGHKGFAIPTINVSQQAGLAAALASPCNAVRAIALDKFRTMKDANLLASVKELTAAKNAPVLRARALWQLRYLADSKDAAALTTPLLADADPRFVIEAMRLEKMRTGRTPVEYPEAWVKHPSAAVRREGLLLSREAPTKLLAAQFWPLAKQYDGTDHYYLAALNIALGEDPERRKTILADFGEQFPTWNQQTANLVFELRPPGLGARLEKYLADTTVAPALRARVVDVLATSDDPTTGLALLKLVADSDSAELRAQAVTNLKLFLPTKWSALRTRPELPKAIEALLARPERQLDALGLIAGGELVALTPQVADLAAKETTPAAVRVQAAQTLGKLPTKDAALALIKLTETTGPVQLAALAALGGQVPVWSETPGTKIALARLQAVFTDDKADQATRDAALNVLAELRPGTAWLLALKQDDKLPAAFAVPAGVLLRGSRYQDLRNRAMILFPAPGKIDPKKLPSIADLARIKGDAVRGKALLAASLKSEVQCLKCHVVRGIGGQVGPDLSVIGKKGSRENLIESILNPSKAIADQYIVQVVETTTGQTISGLLMRETETDIMLRDATGKDFTIALKNIEERKKSLVSIMPADIVAGLSTDELVDIVEYMLTLKTPMLTLDRWDIIGPFDLGAEAANFDKAFEPEKKIDLAASYSGKSGTVKWQSVKPELTGYVDLQAFFAGNSTQIVSYATREIESPADQEATILLGTDDMAKLWVNGELVFTTREQLAATPEKHAVKVKLRKGVNRLLLKITNGGDPHGFYLSVTSEQELKPVGR